MNVAETDDGDPDLFAHHGQEGGQGGQQEAALVVKVKGEEEEDGAEELGPTHGPCDGLSVYRVNSEQEGGDKAGVWPDIVTADLVEQDRDNDVEEEVEEMIAKRLEAMEDVIEPKREDAQRSVGLMRLLLGHRDAPEVIVEDVDQGRGGQEVAVVPDGAGVIKHEAAAEAVEVTDQASQDQAQASLTGDLIL